MRTTYSSSSTACLTAAVILLSTGSVAQNQNALDFDGVDDVVSVAGASILIAGSQELSISFWVRPDNTAPAFPDLDGFAGFRNDTDCDLYLTQVSPANTVEARFRNSAMQEFTITAPILQVGSWQHLALVYNGSELKLYHNGTLAASIAASGSISNASVPMFIGDLIYSGNNFYLDGRMDEIGVWTRALSATEVSCLVNGEVDLLDGDLVLYYACDQGTAGGNNIAIFILDDETGNLDGALTGFSMTGNSSNFVNGPGFGTPVAATICQGESYLFGSQTLTMAGTYTNTFPGTGCDSLVTLTLTVSTPNVSVIQSGSLLTAAAGSVLYQWLDCDNGFASIPGATSPVYSAPADGDYAVAVTNSNGCTDTSACYTVSTIGIEAVDPALDITIVYDEASSRLLIQRDLQGEAYVSISDMTGRSVLRTTIPGGHTAIAVDQLRVGAYLVEVRTELARRIMRFARR